MGGYFLLSSFPQIDNEHWVLKACIWINWQIRFFSFLNGEFPCLFETSANTPESSSKMEIGLHSKIIIIIIKLERFIFLTTKKNLHWEQHCVVWQNLINGRNYVKRLCKARFLIIFFCSSWIHHKYLPWGYRMSKFGITIKSIRKSHSLIFSSEIPMSLRCHHEFTIIVMSLQIFCSPVFSSIIITNNYSN